MKEIFEQELQLTTAQGRVLNLILSWLDQNKFPVDDQEMAKEIWLRYISITDNNKRKTNLNIRIWAAAVIYILGRQRGYRFLNQAKLAVNFNVSTTSISTRGQEIVTTLQDKKKCYGKNLAKVISFLPNDQTMELFHELIVFTRTSTQWMGYIGEVFEEFIELEAPQLSVDLLLELLVFITCDRTLSDGKKIVDHFLESSKRLHKEEIAFLKKIRTSRFGLFEVKTNLSSGVLLLYDLFRETEVQVELNINQIKTGDFMMGRIIANDQRANLWNPAIFITTLDPVVIVELETLTKRWFWEFSVANKGWASKESFIQENSFRFWRWFLEDKINNVNK